MSKTNEQIEPAVRRALSDDPRLPFADAIAVEAYEGLVTLVTSEINVKEPLREDR